MTIRRLLDEVRTLASQDGALDEEADLEVVLDYCALSGLDGASVAYLQVLGSGDRHESETTHD